MHLLLLLVSRISVCTYMVQRIGLQSSDQYVHYYYGDCVEQSFVAELGGGLVYISIIGYVNILTNLVALLLFSSGVYIPIIADWWSYSFWHQDDHKAFYQHQKHISRPTVSDVRGITQDSASSKKSLNPRWSPVVILNYAESFSETDRESSFALV